MEKSLNSRSKELALQICDICDGLSAQDALTVLTNATIAFFHAVGQANDADLIMPYLLYFASTLPNSKKLIPPTYDP